VVIVEGEGAVLRVNLGHPKTAHCNQWGLCDALFSNYFEDLLRLSGETVWNGFLADRTIGRAFGTLCRLSVCRLSVCRRL